MSVPLRHNQPNGLSRAELEQLIKETKKKLKEAKNEVRRIVLRQALRQMKQGYRILFSDNFEVIKKDGTIKYR